MKIKDEKGITLVTLIVYVTVMLLVITIVTLIKVNVDRNLSNIVAMKAYVPEINRISMYMLGETKNKENGIKKLSGDGTFVEFTNGNKYAFLNGDVIKIDKDDSTIKICENLENCIFEYETENGKEFLKLTIQIGEQEIITKTIEYVFI